MDLALAGSQQAYALLFQRHWRQLLFTVRKLVPDPEESRDIAIEAFAKAFGNLHRFNQEYNFNTWLHRIAINHSIDYLRKKRFVTLPLSTSVTDDVSGFVCQGNDGDYRNQNPEAQFIEEQKACIIEQVFSALPHQMQEVARMRFMDNCSYQQISGLLKVPLGTVKARLHRARVLLKQMLLPWRNQLN